MMSPASLARIATTCDVLVVGSGIAGCTAAVEAARAGARVFLASTGPLFSGSSFYPGTWGLGLISPVDTADEQDLIETICHVGGGVEDRALVETFVHNIPNAIRWIEELGVTLKKPASDASAQEAAFIPCFDHKHRIWRGLERESMIRAFSREIERLGITVLERCELLDLVASNSSAGVEGAILFSRDHHVLHHIRCRATVLCAGGTSGLFERRLTSNDVLGSVHGIALDHGCRLTNIEFMQMMPGLIAPKRGIVFNEKSFRFARTQPELPRDLLEMRSGYGPFTSRLPSRAVDLAIDAAGEKGLPLSYRFPEHNAPEFVEEFCRWLETEHGIRPSDELRIAMYAHASNGGIAIDAHGSTGVPGLFAAGEATGGMHGADRIGGLSSANGLVFGRRAGQAAAAYAANAAPHTGTTSSRNAPADAHDVLQAWLHATQMRLQPMDCETAANLTRQLRRTMSAYAMINRTEEGLKRALHELDDIAAHIGSTSCADSRNLEATVRAVRLDAQLKLARAMITAMLARPHSLGSHFRADESKRADS